MKAQELTKDSVCIYLHKNDWEIIVTKIVNRVLRNEDEFAKLLLDFRDTTLSREFDAIYDFLELDSAPIVIDRTEALKFSDNLVDALFPRDASVVPTSYIPEKPKLKLITICVQCHKAKIKGETCELCEVTK